MMFFRKANRKHIIVIGTIFSISLLFLLLFYTKSGLTIQYYLAEQSVSYRYERFLVPWLLRKQEPNFQSSAGSILKQGAIYDLHQAREAITSSLLRYPDAMNYSFRGKINEMLGSDTNALKDFEAALSLKMNGDGNMDVSAEGLSNAIRRVRARIECAGTASPR